MSIFNTVKITRPKRTAFNLSHQTLFTSDFGRLTPICSLDLVPGDTAFINCAPLVRFSPMLAPPFGKVDVSTVWFGIPARLVNAKFTKMITGYYQNTEGSSQFLKRPNMMFNFGGDSTDGFVYLGKFYDKNQYLRHNLLDYLGLRTAKNGKAPCFDEIECGRWIAFWMVYYEYFVDQNLGYRPDPLFNDFSATTLKIRTEDGGIVETKSILNWEQFTQICLYESTDFPAVGGYLTIGDCIANGINIDVYKIHYSLYPWLFALPSKCWPKDYFTSALPWAQKGNPVTVPVDFNNARVPVNGSVAVGSSSASYENGFLRTDGSDLSVSATNANEGPLTKTTLTGTLGGSVVFPDNVASFTINDLRSSFALQTWLERNSRCGSRYIEQILSHFGVRSSDSRLQRPEYLGGSRIPVQVSSVAQSSESGETPQGNLAGNALSVGVGKRITYFAEEHMYIIGFMYVQPKAVYSQGMSRLLKRKEFYDFFFPEFAHLGEQAITNGELYYDPTQVANNSDTFGYQSRYSEYKFMNNEVHGDFMHDSLKGWIFGLREFGSKPSLSPEFLQVSPNVEPSLKSPFPDLNEDGFDKLYCQVDFDIKMLRPMPKYGTPYL